MLPKRLPLIILALALNCAAAFAQKTPYEYKDPDWAFPRAGMETKTNDGKTVYNLGKDFWAMFADFQGIKTAGVTIPPDFDKLIDELNRKQAGAISNRDQFIVAVVLMKAVITPEDHINEYLGNGVIEGYRLHFFKTANGAYVGGAVSENRQFVMLIPVPDPDTIKK